MSVSGHVFRVGGKRRPVWRAKYRLPDGRQVQKTIGPAWTERGRPPAGFFTKRTAEEWLRSVLGDARRGELPGLVRTGATFAVACDEYLTWLERDRERKPNTLRDYRSIMRAHVLPAFGAMAVEDISRGDIEAFAARFDSSNRTKLKVLTVLHGVLKRARRVHRLQYDPMALVEKPIQRRKQAGLEVFSVEEVLALVRAAASEQDAAIFRTAAFTGLRRGELVALRWRDVDFERAHIRVTASYSEGHLATPKSGTARSVPLAPEVAEALARLACGDLLTGDDDLVFPGLDGGYLDGSALYRRYKDALKRAGLRDLRFHDLRHMFGTRVIGRASILQVKEWMGHADVDTTMQYLHYAPSTEDAALIAKAFRSSSPESVTSP
jgi:integrase